jgi:hypothetical protein
MADTRRRRLAAAGVNAERLEAAVVKNREHDIAALGQRPADLDLSVVSVEATAQLEDPPCSRGATGVEQRALAQLAVDLLGARPLRFNSGDEKARHLRRAFAGTAG